MAWESSSSFRRTFTRSNWHQVIFKTKAKIIGLTITRTNMKQKLVVFTCKGKTLVINQIKGYIKDDMSRCHAHIV